MEIYFIYSNDIIIISLTIFSELVLWFNVFNNKTQMGFFYFVYKKNVSNFLYFFINGLLLKR